MARSLNVTYSVYLLSNLKKDDVIDRIESSGIEFFEDVRKGYQQLAIERKEVELIDASQEIELIGEQTKNLVARLL